MNKLNEQPTVSNPPDLALLCCPFCRGKAEIDFDFVGKDEKTMHNITCKSCEARTGGFHNKLDAATAWNTRAI